MSCHESDIWYEHYENLKIKAEALVNKLKEIMEHPSYKATWSIAHIHGHRYDGPTWEKELEELGQEID